MVVVPREIKGDKLFEKNFGFGIRGLKNFPALIPLTGFLGFACALAGCYIGYALYQKSDVRINKGSELAPHQRIESNEPQKLFTVGQKYQRIPEVEQLRSELGSYKY